MEVTCVNTFRSSEDNSIKKEARRAFIVERADAGPESEEELPNGWVQVRNDGVGTEKAGPVKVISYTRGGQMGR